MKSLKDSLGGFVSQNGSSRTAEMAALSRAWESVAPPEVLAHTGSVIYDKKNPDVVVIFTENSLYRAEFEAEKELYRLLLSEKLRLPTEPPLQEVRFAVDRRTARVAAMSRDQKFKPE